MKAGTIARALVAGSLVMASAPGLAGGAVQRATILETTGGVAPNGGFVLQVDNAMAKRALVVKRKGKTLPVTVDAWSGPSGFQHRRTYHIVRPAKGDWKPGATLKVKAFGQRFTVKVGTTRDTMAPTGVKLLSFRDATFQRGFPGRRTTRKATYLDVSAITDVAPVVLLHAELTDGTVVHHGLIPGAATAITLSPGTAKCVKTALVMDSAGHKTPIKALCKK